MKIWPVNPSLVLSLLLGFSSAAAPLESPPSAAHFSVELGVGRGTEFGRLGFRGRYRTESQVDFHGVMGVDLIGLVTGVGLGFHRPSETTKCLLFFECKTDFILSTTMIHSSPAPVTVTDAGLSGTYRQSEGFAGVISFGGLQKFESGFIAGAELGYRAWLKRPKGTYMDGDYSPILLDAIREAAEDSLALGLSFGYLW